MRFLNRFYYIVFILIFWMAAWVCSSAQDTGTDQDDVYELGITYAGEVFGNVAGGTGQGIAYIDNIDLDLKVHLGNTALGWDNTTFFIYGLGNQGGSISGYAGDLQGVSNIEAENSWRFFELWLQKKILGLRSSVLAGLYDINSEFNMLNSSLFFINSSHGLDPALGLSGVLGPSTFPHTSLGVRLKVNPIGGWVFKAAVLDGVPGNPENTRGTKIFLREKDGLLLLAEIALFSKSAGELQTRERTTWLKQSLGRGTVGENKFKFVLGGWAYTRERRGWQVGAVPKGPSLSMEQDRGLYALGEVKVYSETRDESQGLSLFSRASIANEQISRLAGYVGGGLSYTGLFRGRGKDKTGIGVAHAVNSGPFRDINTRLSDGFETNIELTHIIHFTNLLQLQGDIQYIINPNMDTTLDNALVGGIRLLISFN